MRGDSPMGDTVNPELVHTTCDRCQQQFQTHECAIRGAEEHGKPVLCDTCETTHDSGVVHPDQFTTTEAEVRDDIDTTVGPDVEPQIRAILDEPFEFELPDMDSVSVSLKKGTEDLGTIHVKVGAAEGLYLPVTVTPSLEVFSEDARKAIISELSKNTLLIVDPQ